MQQTTIANKKQALMLRFSLHRAVTAVEFRSHLGAVVASNSAPLLGLFNRAADGSPSTSFAHVRFETMTTPAGAVGMVHGLDDEAMALVRRLECLAYPEELSDRVLVDTEVGTKDAHHDVVYRAERLVVAKNASQYMLWKASSLIEKLERVQQVVRAGLDRQADALQICRPPRATVKHIISEWTQPKLLHKVANVQVRLCDVLLTMPSELLGHWSAGPLGNRGHGHIVRCMP